MPRPFSGFVLIILVAGCATADDRAARIDRALASAAQFLTERQDPDGAWRSGVHGSFRDGPSLTPHVLSTLFFIGRDGEPSREAFHRGQAYLATLIQEDRSPALHFPVYTAAAASWVAVLESRSADSLRIESMWVDYLRARQLSGALGWDAHDVEFGGWGYAPVIPRKPRSGEGRHPLIASNLSATLFAIGALRSAQIPPSDPAYRDALQFVMRCQNFSDDPSQRDDRFDDGGFFFQPNDAATNKAGIAGVDRFGRTRFNSYGSTTCDGIRALLQCGLPPDHPRVVAARHWIEKNFTVLTNPGTFAPDRESIREATYFYYCWSLAHAMRRGQVHELNRTAALADELISRQRADGSWKNELTDAKEDDPLVATPFAAAALAICREQLSKSGHWR